MGFPELMHDDERLILAWLRLKRFLRNMRLIVQDEGSDLDPEPKLNFIGANVTAVDNPGAQRIDVTITDTPPHIIQDGVPQDYPQEGRLRFGPEFTVTDIPPALPGEPGATLIGLNIGQNILYVAPYGDDTTAEVGNPFLPYETIPGAVADAPCNSTIMVGPGNYSITEAVQVGDPCAGGSGSIAIVGSSASVTEVAANVPAGAPVFEATGADTLTRLSFSNLTVTNAGTGPVVSVDGSSSLAGYGNLTVENVSFATAGTSAIEATCVETVNVDNADVTGDTTFTNVGWMDIYGLSKHSTLTVEFDNTDPMPGAYTHATIDMRATRIDGELVLTGLVECIMDGSVRTGDVTASFTESGGWWGKLESNGRHAAVEVEGEGTVARQFAVLDHARMTSFAMTAAHGVRVSARMKGVSVTGAITGDATTDLELSHGDYDEASLTLGAGGTAGRLRISEAVNLGMGPNNVTMTNPLPAGDNNYDVHVESSAAFSSPMITNKTNAGFTITTLAADANARWTLVHR